MTDCIQIASEGDYEAYIDFLRERTDDKIESCSIGLKEAAAQVVSEAFEQLRNAKPVLDKLFIQANEVLEPPCKDDTDLEQQVLDTIIQEIHDNEMYLSKKTGEIPDSHRLNL